MADEQEEEIIIARPRPRPRPSSLENLADVDDEIPRLPMPRRIKISAPKIDLEEIDISPTSQIEIDPETGTPVLKLLPVPDSEIRLVSRENTPTHTSRLIGDRSSLSLDSFNQSPQNGGNLDDLAQQSTVCYQTPHGMTSTTRENVVASAGNGINVVVTPERTWNDRGRVLKEKDLKVYQILSILSIFVFFPLGLLALYYARRTYTEFYSGLERGDIENAKRMAKRCERCLILSIIACVILAALLVAILGKSAKDSGSSKVQSNSASWRHHFAHPPV